MNKKGKCTKNAMKNAMKYASYLPFLQTHTHTHTHTAVFFLLHTLKNTATVNLKIVGTL